MGSYTKQELVYEDDTIGKGRGLFAAMDIPATTLIGIMDGRAKAIPVIEVPKHSTDLWVELLIEDDILYYLDRVDQKVEGVELMNHSCTPNCEMVPHLLIRAKYDIKRGQELTLNYIPITKIWIGIHCLCKPGCLTII